MDERREWKNGCHNGCWIIGLFKTVRNVFPHFEHQQQNCLTTMKWCRKLESLQQRYLQFEIKGRDGPDFWHVSYISTIKQQNYWSTLFQIIQGLSNCEFRSGNYVTFVWKPDEHVVSGDVTKLQRDRQQTRRSQGAVRDTTDSLRREKFYWLRPKIYEEKASPFFAPKIKTKLLP